MTRIMQPKSTYTVDYPEAIEFTNKQVSIFWPPDEIKVEKDVHDIRVEMTEAERHGVLSTLKLFTMYELIVGGEYWGEKVFNMFPRPDIQRMANCFSFYELNIHAPFYAKINEALNLANDEFYTNYLKDPVLKERIEKLEEAAGMTNPALFLVVLGVTEGVILYSSFAFLKHFQAKGKNKLLNIVRGINFSARDEALHSEASAWLFRTLCKEEGINPVDLTRLAHPLVEAAVEHEKLIAAKIFEKGEIDGITQKQLENFIESRADVVLRNFGMAPLYNVEYNPIGEWFYRGINGYVANDFFTGMGREYTRTWDSSSFKWEAQEQE